MIRIGLFLSAETYVGGVTHYTRMLLGALSRFPADRFHIVILYGDKRWEKELQAFEFDTQYVRDSARRFSFHNIWRIIGLPVAVWRLLVAPFHPVCRMLKKLGCDIWIFPATNPWSYLSKERTLVMIHDLMHRYERRFPEVSTRARFRAREYNIKNILKYARTVVVDSNTGEQQVRESYNDTKTHIGVLPYVAPVHITEVVRDDSVISEYGVPGKYLFYPATFWQHKNHKNIIHAVYKLVKDYPDIVFVFSGARRNSYEEVYSLIDRFDLKDHFIQMNYVSDEQLKSLYLHAKGLVMPTYFGPTNLPPLEAFSLDCPVAVSGIYGMKEQLGEAALYFDPESVDEIADCIEKLWIDDSLCKDLIRKGKDHISGYSMNEFSSRLEQIVEASVSQ